jgi:hypothetical protein
MFGDPYKKRTCLWLYGLPLLKPTNIVTPLAEWVNVHRSPTMRSKTFPGIAEAMATQWDKNFTPQGLLLAGLFISVTCERQKRLAKPTQIQDA